MRPIPQGDHGADAVEALATDQYLDALLAQADGWAAKPVGTKPKATKARATQPAAVLARTDDGAVAARGGEASPPEAAESGDPDAAVRHAGDVLRATLLRAHPSFRFEERLAAQLNELAGGRSWRPVANAGGSSDVIPFPVMAAPVEDPLLAAVLAGKLDPSDQTAVERANGMRAPSRPLLVGGAITSAAISLFGVAWVAWRASRPGTASMTRAARAAHARRLSDLADLGARVSGGPA